MRRGTFLGALSVLVVMELFYLFAVTQQVHDAEDFIFRMVVVFATLFMGGITVFALPKD